MLYMDATFSASLMCMDFLQIKQQIEILNERIDSYHIDIMDGHFCKNLALSPDLLKCVKRISQKPMDVHLMTTTPTDWIPLVAAAGADIISPQAETINADAFRVIQMIKDLNCKVGVVLNPATPLDYIRHYINRLDQITIMTVDVGFAGQKFIPEMLDKIAAAKQTREENGYQFKIQVDGSCNEHTFKRLHNAGTDIYVLGSSGLFNLDNDLTRAFTKMCHNFSRETGIQRLA